MSVNWKTMFVKYVDIVAAADGIDHLHGPQWTPEEWEAIASAHVHAHIQTDPAKVHVYFDRKGRR